MHVNCHPPKALEDTKGTEALLAKDEAQPFARIFVSENFANGQYVVTRPGANTTVHPTAQPLGYRTHTVAGRERHLPSNRGTILMQVYNRNEIASWTEDQKALHTAKLNELLNMDKFGVVEVVEKPQSPQVFSTTLGIKTATGRIL